MAQKNEETPEPGDLIEIFRGAYQHWAVYIGDGFVVHLVQPSELTGAGLCSSGSITADRAVVKKEKLKTVAGTDRWKINNLLDKEYKPRPSAVIVKEACALVGKEKKYSIINRNCEHFATELRYGKAKSRQGRDLETTVLAAAIILFLGSVALVVATLMGVKK